MRKIQANKRHKKQKNRRGALLARVKDPLSSKRIKKQVISRKKIISPYPYIITISYFATNVFFTVADIEGRTQIWTSTGRSDFQKKDKTTYMAVIQVTERFYNRLWNLGIRRVLLRWKNFRKRNTRFAVKNALRKIRRQRRILLKYAGFFSYTPYNFNGCRRKKKRRK